MRGMRPAILKYYEDISKIRPFEGLEDLRQWEREYMIQYNTRTPLHIPAPPELTSMADGQLQGLETALTIPIQQGFNSADSWPPTPRLSNAPIQRPAMAAKTSDVIRSCYSQVVP